MSKGFSRLILPSCRLRLPSSAELRRSSPGTFNHESSPKAAIGTASSRSLHLADRGKKLIGVTQYHLPFHHSALFLFPAQHPPSLGGYTSFPQQRTLRGHLVKVPRGSIRLSLRRRAKVKFDIGPKNLCKVLYEPRSRMRFDQAHQQQSSSSAGLG